MRNKIVWSLPAAGRIVMGVVRGGVKAEGGEKINMVSGKKRDGLLIILMFSFTSFATQKTRKT